MKYSNFFVILLVVGVCLMSFSFFKRDYVDDACDIRKKVSKELAKKYKMHVVGSGGGFMKNVNLISVSFRINRILSKNEARCMIIDCVENYLKAFNENEKIRPYLSNYPFTRKNLDIAIFISTPSGGTVYHPNFYVVSADSRELIAFISHNPNGGDFPWVEESYQETLKKIKESSQCSTCHEKQIKN